MKVFKKLYQNVMDLAAHPKAVYWLGVISFIESSFFPIPADVMFAPMALAKRRQAYRFALVATVTSVLGALFGYYIGMYGYETFALPILKSLGKAETIEYYRDLVQDDLFLLWGLLLSSGLTHIPPIKVVTILAGVAKIDLLSFLVSAIVGRGLRFYLLAFLFKRYGADIKHFIEKRMNLIFIGFFALLGGAYGAMKLL